MTRLLREPGAFAAECDAARRRGARVGLVPTMGALHRGHLSLIDRARRAGADHIALTLFVNPLQFAKGDDLDRYPRTLAEDLEASRKAGVDMVFAPTVEAMYPPGFQTAVEVGPLAEAWEGACRPGHFRGVTTIVAKLFALTGPCIAVFGRKDYQQCRVLEQMVSDLRLPVRLETAPVVREADGLALSSRNRYLSAEERTRARAIFRGLEALTEAFEDGERGRDRLLQRARQPMELALSRIDYVALVDPRDLRPSPPRLDADAVALVAGWVGSTRLIDHIALTIAQPPAR